MIWRLLLIAAALLAAVLPLPPSRIEQLYSQGIFPRLQHGLTTLSNLTAFALFDGFVIVGVGLWLWLTLRDWRRGSRPRLRFAGRTVLRTGTLAAAAYLGFLFCWGWNYQRPPLTEVLHFDRTQVTSESARRLAIATVAQLNALHGDAHREDWLPRDQIDQRLLDAFWRTQEEIGTAPRIVAGRPKRTMFDLYFRRAGVAGMTDPYFLETLVASDLLPFERPQVVAHEWAHLAGYNDEGEANFVSWLATLQGSAAHQYSGWLFLYAEVADALGRAEFRAIAEGLDAGPREDLFAIRTRLTQNVSRRLSAVGWSVYDQYLKANRVESGTRSYGQVVSLILGTNADAGHRPVRR